MTRFTRTVMLAASLLAFGVGLHAQNDNPPNHSTPQAAAAEDPFARFQRFSAVLNGGLGRDANRKLYRSGHLMRFDFDDHYRVVDLTTRTLAAVYPNRCSSFPMMDPSVFPFSRKFRVESSTTEGKETVDGHTCTVQNMVLISDGAMSPRFNMKLWQADDLNGFPLKVDVENVMSKAKFTITYSNVSLDSPDPKLFQHPGKCNNSPALDSPGSPTPASKPAAKSASKPAAKTPAKPAPEPK